MKKILLFIFTFGITISLYNLLNSPIEAKAITFNDIKNDTSYAGVFWFENSTNLPGNYIVGAWYDRSGAYFTDNGQFTTTNHYGFELYSFYTLEGNAFDINTGYNYLTVSYPFVRVRGTITTYEHAVGPYYNSEQDYQNGIYYPPDSVDVSQCAFFFEPQPNTDLYSMYCFPLELDDGEVVTVYYNNLNNTGFEITEASINTLNRCYLVAGSNNEYYHSIEYWLEMIDNIKLENDNSIDFLFTTPIYAMYCNFIENNGNPNYNIFPLTEESWWDDIVNMIGFEDTTLGFIWDWLFSDPDPDYGHSVVIDNSPSPTPLPTPIPYRTTLVPDGNGGYEFQYEYEDENGNTITASAPPEQPKYDGNNLVTQPVNINISGVPVSDVKGVQSLLNVIGEADADYQEGFQVIGQSFSVLPSKWFLFFGIPAAIIFIAGIIKSLLG